MSAKNKTVKKKKHDPKIHKEELNNTERTHCKEGVFFSFKHLTSNTKYNFDYYTKDKSNMGVCYKSLLERLSELSCNEWKHWLMLGKSVGMETISPPQLKFQPKNLQLSRDDTVYVVRFNSQEKRLLGIKKDADCSVLYIIGFDFNYSAYPHG